MCKKCIKDVESLYAKDGNLKREDVKTLKEWMSTERHLPEISEFQIICFLNSCYYDIEATKLCIENYYTLRTHCPEFFAGKDLDDESFNYHLHTVFAHALPNLTRDGHQILYGKIRDLSVARFNFDHLVRVVDVGLVTNAALTGPQLGHAILVDGDGLQFGHVLKLSPASIRRFLFFLQEASPIRLVQIHVVNVSAVTRALITLAKPFLQRELHCHRDLSAVVDAFGAENLPEDVGGRLGTIEELHKRHIETVREHMGLIKEDEMLKSDESRRVGEVSGGLRDLVGGGGWFRNWIPGGRS